MIALISFSRISRIVKRWRRTSHLPETDPRVLTCALQNMRMSCNSTYLLDHETDHGTKVDELAILLGELFERPEAKAVIFSQWVRTHELIIRRLEAARFGYVLFHGGVPAEKRGELVEHFHRDPGCRVFLSTDAGGVGLNLQHAASTVINMDLPWNPAVLEQRIGLVERTLRALHGYFISFPTRKETPRKDSAIRALGFSGYPTPTNRARGFNHKWADFRNSFAAIHNPKSVRVRKAKGAVYRVWALCEKYRDKILNGQMSRAELLSRCSKKGINSSTAAVQIAAWKSDAKTK